MAKVVNNKDKTCIIKRFDYKGNLSQEDEDLLSVGLQVNPNSYFSLHGKKIEYLFEESPEYLEFDQNASSSSMVKYELHYLEDADWDVY